MTDRRPTESTEVDRNETIIQLNSAGLDGRRLVDHVLRHCAYRPEAVEAFFAATLISEQTRAAIPWRMPSVVTQSMERAFGAAIDSLPPSSQRSLELLGASQELPPALRRDSLARAFRYADLELRDLDQLVTAKLLTLGERTDLSISPVLRSFLESRREWSESIERIARATPAGHDQVRIAARAALPEIDIALSAMLETVAKERRSNVDHLVTAQDLTVAAMLAESPERGRLLIEVAEVLQEGTFAPAAIAALNDADSLLQNPTLRAKSLELRGRIELSLGDPIRAASTQLRAAEILTGLDDTAAAHLFISAAGSLFLTNRAEESGRLTQRARQLGGHDPIVNLGADVLEGVLLVRAGECERAEPFLKTLAMLCEHTVADTALTDIDSVEHLLWIYHSTLLILERFEESVAFGHKVISLCNRLDRRQLKGAALSNQALAAWAQGDLFGAKSWVYQLDLSEEGPATGTSGTFARELVLATTRSSSLGANVQTATATATAADAERPLDGATLWNGYRAVTKGLAAVGDDDIASVRSSFEPLLRDLSKNGSRNFGHVGWLTLLLEAQLQAGEIHAATRTGQIQELFAATTKLNYHQIPMTRATALLAHHDQTLWDTAISAHAKWGNPVELGHTLRSHGEQILRLSPSAITPAMWDAAYADLERARYVFGEAGALGFQQRSERRLTEISTRRRLLVPGLDVSEREMDIVRLVQNGATNKEIATKLDLSLKTIESHLRNVYQRNELRNRSELIARL